MITQLLIADSDPWLRERSRRYFADRGYQVEVAADALGCLDAIRRVPPDVLVLEQQLHWGGGEGVLAVLREDRCRWPESVILTTSDCGELLPRPEPLVAAVLRKPFCMAALGEAVRRAQYGDTLLAARFLKQAQEIAVRERWHREWGSAIESPRRPHFHGAW